MTTLYKTSSYSREIEPVEVSRVTDKSVWLMRGFDKKERREARFCSYSNYYDSWAEAHQYLMNKHIKKIEYAEENLKRAGKELLDVESLAPPE